MISPAWLAAFSHLHGCARDDCDPLGHLVCVYSFAAFFAIVHEEGPTAFSSSVFGSSFGPVVFCHSHPLSGLGTESARVTFRLCQAQRESPFAGRHATPFLFGGHKDVAPPEGLS
jgi:hypothetical protein